MSTDLQPYQERTPFEPREHLMQIPNKGGKTEYLPVQWRLVWFREQCPQGTIETEMVLLDLDRETEEETYAWNNETRHSEKVMKRANGFAVFRTIAKDGKGGVATGTKSEKAASFPDFIEKAETGSVGRALAALGYGTQFAPELNEEHRIVDAPVEQTDRDKRAYTERKPFVESTVAIKEEQPAPGTTAAIVRMVEIAKKRALGLGADWALLKTSVLGEPIPDGKLIVHHFTKINGELTKREKAVASGT